MSDEFPQDGIWPFSTISHIDGDIGKSWPDPPPQGWAYRPTLRERFWRWIGYEDPPAPDAPEDVPGFAAGSLRIDTVHEFSFVERLRLLISGRCMTRIRVKTDKPIDRSMPFGICGVLPPGYKRHLEWPIPPREPA